MDEQWLRDSMEEWRDYGHLNELEQLARAGFELDQPVADDYAFIVRPGEESPMRLVEEDE